MRSAALGPPSLEDLDLIYFRMPPPLPLSSDISMP